MTYFKTTFVSSLILLSTLQLLAQDITEPKATIKTENNNPRPLLKYLFNTYGIEDSERILLNIKDYETTHNIKVLFIDEYQDQVQKIETKLATTASKEEYVRLSDYKTRFINFSEIETTVTTK